MIRKIFVFAALMVFTASCSEAEDKILIAYFSRTGTTKSVAEKIAENISADMFRIETVNPYPDDYEQTKTRAQQEQNDNARPELSGHVSSMERYNVIFLGYPIWWGTVPMAIHTFLEGYDFTGKRVIPFNTHGGSGLGRSIADIKSALPDSDVEDGFAVRGAVSDEDLHEWLSGFELDTEIQTAANRGSNSGGSSGGCGITGYGVIYIILALIFMLKSKYRKGLTTKSA